MDMHVIAAFVSRPETVYAVVGCLVFWALASGISLWWGTRKLAQAFRRANDILARAPGPAEFAQNYEEISKALAAEPIIGTRWREYRDTLVLPTSGQRPVQATSRANTWFDVGLLRTKSVKTDLRYHAALPNLLVGAGLLFTFVGLAAALGTAGGIVGSAEQAGRNEALRTLLDTASFKFITSLAGLFLSISYALYRKRRLQNLDRAVDVFLTELESRVPLLTPARLQHEANELLQQQYTQLQTFSTDLALNIGTAFDKAFDTRLSEHIGPLTEAIDRLSRAQGAQNEDAMRSMTDAFLQQLQNGAGDQMKGVVESIGTLTGNLQLLQTSLSDAALKLSGAADSMATRMGEGAEAALTRVTDQIGGVVDTLRAVAKEAQASGSDAGNQMAERMVAASASFEEAARSVATTLANAASSLEAQVGNQAKESTSRLNEQFEKLVSDLAALAEKSRSVGAESLQSVTTGIDRAAATLQSVASGVADRLMSSANSSGEAFAKGADDAAAKIAAASTDLANKMSALTAAADNIATRTSEFSRTAQEVSAPLAATAKDLRLAGEAARNVAEPFNTAAQNITRAMDQMVGVSQRLTAAQTTAEKLTAELSVAVQRFEGVDKELARTLQELQAGLQGFTEQVAIVVNQTDDNLGKAATQLASLVSSLQGTLEDFDPLGLQANSPARTPVAPIIDLTNRSP